MATTTKLTMRQRILLGRLAAGETVSHRGYNASSFRGLETKGFVTMTGSTSKPYKITEAGHLALS